MTEVKPIFQLKGKHLFYYQFDKALEVNTGPSMRLNACAFIEEVLVSIFDIAKACNNNINPKL